MKKALITGITGQDGSYLAEFLLAHGYEVHGVIRRASTFNTSRLEAVYADPHADDIKLRLHYGDMTDAGCLRKILESVAPDEVYNLAAQSHVRVSFDQPQYTSEVVGTGTLHLLEAVRDYCTKNGPVKFYQAGSSEMFGAAKPPQSELTCFAPRSPYAVSKVAAHFFCANYREAYGLFIVNGILFNHESPRRGETFVTRKITKALARIKLGLQDKLYLGNLDSRRDWGYAGDYVEAMWRMLQHHEPDDYVIATGEAHTVREFLDVAGTIADIDWTRYVEIDPRYYRPTEVDALLGDSSKARRVLGWQPKVTFNALVGMMMQHDMQEAEREALFAHHSGGRAARGLARG
ncbi:MAG: GDP-mannose 4,6-dehydratase [Vicinamibacterales bacterium]